MTSSASARRCVPQINTKYTKYNFFLLVPFASNAKIVCDKLFANCSLPDKVSSKKKLWEEREIRKKKKKQKQRILERWHLLQQDVVCTWRFQSIVH